MPWWNDDFLFKSSKYSEKVSFRHLGKYDELGYGYSSCRVDIEKEKGVIGSFVVSELPSCCGALFISNVISYRKKRGYSKLIFKTIDDFVRLGRYSAAHCIIPIPEDDASYDRDILEYWEAVASLFEKNGFVKQPTGIVNVRTMNTLYTFIKEYKYD